MVIPENKPGFLTEIIIKNRKITIRINQNCIMSLQVYLGIKLMDINELV